MDALGRIVLYGGYILDDGGPGDDKAYDPIEGPNVSVSARNAPASAIGHFAWAADDLGRLYGFGGGPGAGGPNSAHCDRYDGATDAWTVLSTMSTPVADACATYDGRGHMLVFGGIDQSGTARTANVAQYGIASNTWSDTAVPDLPVAISGARAILGADGRVYVLGGESGPIGAGSAQTSVYRLDLDSSSWTTVASMSTPRKWFACALGSDDYIYAIGGDNDAGGTNTVEKLFTPRCPTITAGPVALAAWRDTAATFAVTVTGAAPLGYQWRKDGVSLSDGPTGTGSVVSGAGSALLSISRPNESDIGAYDAVVTNACGTVVSASAQLSIRIPPAIPANWEVLNLHPPWAQNSSFARGISNGRIGGSANTPTLLPDGRVFNLDHPIVWSATTLLPADVTPPGSVGGGIYDVEGDLLVGWFWHTWQCWSGGQWWTCAWQSAGYWTAPAMSFEEAIHSSGAEYDWLSATDGQRMVGTLFYEWTQGNYEAQGHYWPTPNQVVTLHFASALDSYAHALDGDCQYGTYYPANSAHAVMWAGTAASHVDLHPVGYPNSSVVGAGDGQAVGSAGSHAGLWVNAGAAFIDLNPPGVASSGAVAAHQGMQIGSTSDGAGVGLAALWIGTPESWFSIGALLPPGFVTSFAEDIEIATDGTVTVVGYGFNAQTGRYEALLWRSVSAPSHPGDIDGDGDVDWDDFASFTACLAGPDVATPSSECSGPHFPRADLNVDGDVDLADFAEFQRVFACEMWCVTGTGVHTVARTTSPACKIFLSFCQKPLAPGARPRVYARHASDGEARGSARQAGGGLAARHLR
ncbi:MAG: hypothetical protein IPM13_06850 [Phycisphaerales bacterium]|nr:hypothetical protein [Phycisphaerales bacterium]